MRGKTSRPRAPTPPAPTTPPPYRLRGLLSAALTRQLRFTPIPAPAHQKPGPCPHPRLHRMPRESSTCIACLGLYAPRHHALSPTRGIPGWVRITATRPLPPSCQGGHTVKSGACEFRSYLLSHQGASFKFKILNPNSVAE